jgi:UDP-N-acetylmuramate--alanine ligase
MDLGDLKNIHFVGIGGIGMSGLAEIALAEGMHVSGCDLKASSVTRRLGEKGVPVSIGHDPAHAAGSDLVVISSAVRRDNPEVLEALDRGVPVMRRAEFLGELTSRRKTVAIAGTHGKTSTSAMTAFVLSEARLDPTIIVGGMLHDIQSNARLGKSDVLVVEADEYDRSFLAFHPTIAVVTNIEEDHLDIYEDLEDIRQAFATFASRVPESGVVIGCVDEPDVALLLSSAGRRTIGYGTGSAAELRAVELAFDEKGSSFAIERGGERLGSVTLRLPGVHYVRNALAAVAVALELGVAIETITAALATFRGVERRFQILGTFHGALVVDDYAHHPTEIRATVEAARGSYPSRRVVALFQPHLYSRTRDFAVDFAAALATADEAWVAPIYPAREAPIEGISAMTIVDAALASGATNVGAVEGNSAAIADRFRSRLERGDLFLTMGAGDVHEVGEALVEVAA